MYQGRNLLLARNILILEDKDQLQEDHQKTKNVLSPDNELKAAAQRY